MLRGREGKMLGGEKGRRGRGEGKMLRGEKGRC
jgi:hypothetical protein